MAIHNVLNLFFHSRTYFVGFITRNLKFLFRPDTVLLMHKIHVECKKYNLKSYFFKQGWVGISYLCLQFLLVPPDRLWIPENRLKEA